MPSFTSNRLDFVTPYFETYEKREALMGAIFRADDCEQGSEPYHVGGNAGGE